MDDPSQRLSAEAMLVLDGTRSLTTKADARGIFEQLGFTVHDEGASLTIEGDRQTFERALGVGLDITREPAPGEATATPVGEPQLPQDLHGLVEAVAFPKRAHMFGPPPRKRRESNG